MPTLGIVANTSAKLRRLGPRSANCRIRRCSSSALRFRAAARCFRDLGRLVQLRKSVAGLVEESSSSICDSYAGVMPFEQRHTKPVFEGTHVAADGRLPDAQRTRSSSDAQVLGDDKGLRDGNRVNRC